MLQTRARARAQTTAREREKKEEKGLTVIDSILGLMPLQLSGMRGLGVAEAARLACVVG